MEIKILFLGEVSRYAHLQEAKLISPDGSLVSGIFNLVLDLYPDIRQISKFLFISVNGNLVPRHHLVLPGDEIAFFFRSGGG